MSGLTTVIEPQFSNYQKLIEFFKFISSAAQDNYCYLFSNEGLSAEKEGIIKNFVECILIDAGNNQRPWCAYDEIVEPDYPTAGVLNSQAYYQLVCDQYLHEVDEWSTVRANF